MSKDLCIGVVGCGNISSIYLEMGQTFEILLDSNIAGAGVTFASSFTATGLVVTYSTSGVFNVAHGSVATISE